MRNLLLLTIAYLLLRAATLTAQSDVAISDPAGSVCSPFSSPLSVSTSPALLWPLPSADAGSLPSPVSAPPPLLYPLPVYAAPGIGNVPADRPPVFVPDAAAGSGRAWVGADAMFVWARTPLPSATSITAGLVAPSARVGGVGLTEMLSVHGLPHADAGVGMHIFAGGWLDAAQTIGIEGGALFLNQHSTGSGSFERWGNGSNPGNDPANGILNTRPRGR
jgi:hypothetical protein